jgi:hypothetical protein
MAAAVSRGPSDQDVEVLAALLCGLRVAVERAFGRDEEDHEKNANQGQDDEQRECAPVE